MTFKICLSLTLATISILCSAQKIRFYSSEHGLPNSSIHNISQDRQGYIWIATENGASYFDGVHFTTFWHSSTDSTSIANDLVKVTFTDSRGVCWIGTSNGLQTYDREKNIFKNINSQLYVSSIAETPDHKYILVSASGLGILAYDAQNHNIDISTTETLNRITQTPFAGLMYIDSNGYLWLYSEQGGFLKIETTHLALEPIEWSNNLANISQHIVVSAVAEDPLTHNIIIGTYNHGLLIYDMQLGKIRLPKGVANSNSRIRSILAEHIKGNDNELNIWIGSEDYGLQKFDRKTESILKPDFQYAPIDLDNCKVHSIIQDVQGNIWASIFQKGLLIIPKLANRFEYIKLSDSRGSMSVNAACATSIIEDKHGNMWIGTDGAGLFLIEKNGVKSHFSHKNSRLPNDAVLSMAIDKRNTIWFSTYMGGVMSYHNQHGLYSLSGSDALKKVHCMLYDERNDRLFFGTNVKCFEQI